MFSHKISNYTLIFLSGDFHGDRYFDLCVQKKKLEG